MIDKQAEVDQVTQTLDDLLKQAQVVVGRMNAVLLRVKQSGAQPESQLAESQPKATDSKEEKDR